MAERGALAKHEAFETEDQSLSQLDVIFPSPTMVELLCELQGGSLVCCHLVDQINMWKSELATPECNWSTVELALKSIKYVRLNQINSYSSSIVFLQTGMFASRMCGKESKAKSRGKNGW